MMQRPPPHLDSNKQHRLYDQHQRPSTAPHDFQKAIQHAPTKSSSHHFEVPRIAIFADALSSFHGSLKSSARALRKSPTLDNLSGSGSNPPQTRRLSSTSTISSKATPSEPLPESKPLASRRPPASYSSHGITTSFGPPPAIITRGSYDLALRVQSPAAATPINQKQKPYNIQTPSRESLRIDSFALDDDSLRDNISESSKSPLSPTSLPRNNNQSLNAMMDGNSPRTAESEYFDDRPSRYTDGLSPVPGGVSGEESGRSTEDLFLKLAQDNSTPARDEGSQSRLERRLSRGRRVEQRQSLPPSSGLSSRPRRDSSSHDSGYATRSVVHTTDAPRQEQHQQRRASAVSSTAFSSMANSRKLAAISTDQRFNAYRNRYMTTPSQPPSSYNNSRRPSASEPLQSFRQPASYRPSRLNNSSLREFDSVSNTGSPADLRHLGSRGGSHADGAESVVSTTAQSTVWDELHELKSRIHKIELSEQMPSSGGTMSNGSGERPRTATTTVTTMSSSPKHPFKSGASLVDSGIGGPGAANIHPLLHQSLARCKQLLNPALYRSLEAAASDALETAIMAGSGGPQSFSTGSVVNGMGTDRQLRRKADNVCRNLTDLCIALCEGKLDLPSATTQASSMAIGRHESREMPSPQTTRDNVTRTFSRAASLEPESLDQPRPGPSRALERIASRRVSMMSTGGESGSNSPREAPESSQRDSTHALPTATETPSPRIVSKPPRSGTSLLRIRRRATENEEEDPTLRAPSRANTDIDSSVRRRSYRLSPAVASSREYTSQHPLPNSSPITQSSSLRRLNGSSLKIDSPRSPSNGSSLLRDTSRKLAEREFAGDSDATEEDNVSSRRLKRRSLGLYTSTRSSLVGQRGTRSIVMTGGAE